MLMAAMNVRYRDVKYVLPFILQIWMFATPIAYPAHRCSGAVSGLLALNPFWGIVTGLRACLFPLGPLDLTLMGTSFGVGVAVFLAGAYYFHRADRSFADVI